MGEELRDEYATGTPSGRLAASQPDVLGKRDS